MWKSVVEWGFGRTQKQNPVNLSWDTNDKVYFFNSSLFPH